MNEELDLNARNVHEAIDEQVQREGRKPKPVKPFEAPVLAQAHTAIYKMHRYYARRPHNVFAKLIEHYTNPGDVILDPFCGGGVTVVEGLKLRRRVIGVDINPLATWITKVEVEPVDLELLGKIFNEWFDSVTALIKPFFKAKCPDCGGFGSAEWYEWSNVVVCPNCGKDIVLRKAKKIRSGLFQCQNDRCKCRIQPGECEWKPDKLISVFVNCDNCGKKTHREALPYDTRKYNKILREEKNFIKKHRLKIPNDKFPDMDRARDDNIFGKGIKKFKDLMTIRQQLSHALMLKKIVTAPWSASEKSAMVLLASTTLRFTNKMVIRSEVWRGEKPLEWPGHNYWLPFSYLEASPIPVLGNRFKAILKGKTEQAKLIDSFSKFPKTKRAWDEFTNGATCWILTQSSHDINIPDSSVDTVITDPPFGGNVQYGELSDFYLVWLKEHLGLKNLSDKTLEAIETRHLGFEGAKDREFYENMLFKIFKECRRVLKPDGWMVMTFHNRDVGVWMSLHRAALRAGFKLPSESETANRGMVYQPPVQNYTQTIHQRAAGSMLGDFILSFKPTEAPIQLEAIKSQLSLEDEKGLKAKAEEIIKYHGGADETTLMTGLIPYLSQSGLLARIARFDLRILLTNGPFVYNKADKKWYLSDMMREGIPLTAMAMIPAEEAAERLVYSYLSENKQATLDDLLVVIYSQLVNSYRPQMSTIDKVLSKYCKKIKRKGQRRELYVWDPKRKTPDEIKRVLETQLPLTLDLSAPADHNTIIATLCRLAANRGLFVHVGETEQKKSPMLAAISIPLTGLELGLPPKAFRLIKEIDLIILKDSTMLAAIEVATTISTFNKAVNDRFRNLVAVAPNLNVAMNVLVKPEDFHRAHDELYTPANVRTGFAGKVNLYTISKIDEEDFFDDIMGQSI
ncbi:MAG: hypothetical protein JRJ62_13630 [Deltaproteobacteria bacterium]|nr:hypothetical protein [Deltaproteobacteria bacterium]